VDLLDRVHAPAADLLSRVEDILVRSGAPADHPLWPLVRRLAVLPSTALAEVSALAPAQLRATADQLAGVSDALHQSVASVPTDLASQGAAADGFGAAWHSLANQISGASGSADRIEATVAALRDAADWAAGLRRDLAGEIGACLGSAEAVSVRTVSGVPDPATIRAAADIAARVLAVLAAAVDDGWGLIRTRSGIETRVDVSALAVTTGPAAGHIELR
jgi:hypothetical protein